MLNDADLERYARQVIIPDLDEDGQQQLLDAKVLVVGAGGLGSPVVMYLAAAGVGTITIIDDDKIARTDLNRQILHTNKAVGTPDWLLGAAVMVHTIGVVVIIAADCQTHFLLKYRPGNLITDGMNQ